MNAAIDQNNIKDLKINYSKFISLNNFDGVENIEKIYLFNDSKLVFPVIGTAVMPQNGIIVETPHWITKFKNVKEFFLAGLFISSFDANIMQLQNLEKLKFSIPKNADIDKMLSDISKFKALKVIDISDSVIDKKQIERLEKGLPGIEVVDTSFFK